MTTSYHHQAPGSHQSPELCRVILLPSTPKTLSLSVSFSGQHSPHKRAQYTMEFFHSGGITFLKLLQQWRGVLVSIMLKYAAELFLCSPLILVFLISVFTLLPVPWTAHPFLISSNEPPLPLPSPAHNLMVPRWSQQGSQHNIFSSTRGGWPDNVVLA